mmetsp:Transcript_7809/g.16279  ORF Transcript_7809/g.16279 Transcript_7809/m.16279 type:complete len:215 (-) Transcript_7809:109-753(-)
MRPEQISMSEAKNLRGGETFGSFVPVTRQTGNILAPDWVALFNRLVAAAWIVSGKAETVIIFARFVFPAAVRVQLRVALPINEDEVRTPAISSIWELISRVEAKGESEVVVVSGFSCRWLLYLNLTREGDTVVKVAKEWVKYVEGGAEHSLLTIQGLDDSVAPPARGVLDEPISTERTSGTIIFNLGIQVHRPVIQIDGGDGGAAAIAAVTTET